MGPRPFAYPANDTWLTRAQLRDLRGDALSPLLTALTHAAATRFDDAALDASLCSGACSRFAVPLGQCMALSNPGTGSMSLVAAQNKIAKDKGEDRKTGFFGLF